MKQLEQFMPRVNKILIIGWQARESHFLELLRLKPTRVEHLMVVCGNQEAGKKALDHFVAEVGPKFLAPNVRIADGGFTDFVVNRQGDEFFKA